MVLLLPYAYGIGLSSSRKIVKACWEEAAFRVLTGNQQPDHSRINDFRRRHLDALAGLVVQAMRLRQTAGLVKLGHVALDDTKVKARASQHKAMGHERMLQPRGLLRSSGASGSWRARCVRCCAKPRSSMPRRTGSTARASGATSCLQSCGAATAITPRSWSPQASGGRSEAGDRDLPDESPGITNPQFGEQSAGDAEPPPWKPAGRRSSTPKSPPASGSMASGPGHPGDQRPEILMPGAEWIGSSDLRPARRSTPCARRSWSPCPVRSKAPGAWITSDGAAWGSGNGIGALMATTHNLLKLFRASMATV